MRARSAPARASTVEIRPSGSGAWVASGMGLHRDRLRRRARPPCGPHREQDEPGQHQSGAGRRGETGALTEGDHAECGGGDRLSERERGGLARPDLTQAAGEQNVGESGGDGAEVERQAGAARLEQPAGRDEEEHREEQEGASTEHGGHDGLGRPAGGEHALGRHGITGVTGARDESETHAEGVDAVTPAAAEHEQADAAAREASGRRPAQTQRLAGKGTGEEARERRGRADGDHGPDRHPRLSERRKESGLVDSHAGAGDQNGALRGARAPGANRRCKGGEERGADHDPRGAQRHRVNARAERLSGAGGTEQNGSDEDMGAGGGGGHHRLVWNCSTIHGGRDSAALARRPPARSPTTRLSFAAYDAVKVNFVDRDEKKSPRARGKYTRYRCRWPAPKSYRSASASPATTSPTAGAPPSPAARTSRLPTITPSARSATAPACSGVEIPNPTATGASDASRTRSTVSAS